MFKREDFISVMIKDGDVLRPPYPEELDSIVKSANLKFQNLVQEVWLDINKDRDCDETTTKKENE